MFIIYNSGDHNMYYTANSSTLYYNCYDGYGTGFEHKKLIFPQMTSPSNKPQPSGQDIVTSTFIPSSYDATSTKTTTGSIRIVFVQVNLSQTEWYLRNCLLSPQAHH